MATKPATAVAVQTAPAELVNIAVNLDKDDVAAILMSRGETFLKGEIRKHKKIGKDWAAAETKLNNTLEVQLQEAAEAYFESTLETLKGAATALKAKSITSEVSHTGFTLHPKAMDVIHCQLIVRGRSPKLHATVAQDIRLPAAIKKTITTRKASRKKNEENNEAWLTVRRKLADLPSLERRAKAAVAEQRLSATAEGRELIDMLSSGLEDHLASIGLE